MIVSTEGELENMTLYEYLNLMDKDKELTVWDKDYDMEIYFYSNKPNDDWDRLMRSLSEKLAITKISTNGVTVNLSEIIEKNIDKPKMSDLFVECNIESIMDDIQNIFAGNVSEKWMKKFVAVLE